MINEDNEFFISNYRNSRFYFCQSILRRLAMVSAVRLELLWYAVSDVVWRQGGGHIVELNCSDMGRRLQEILINRQLDRFSILRIATITKIEPIPYRYIQLTFSKLKKSNMNITPFGWCPICGRAACCSRFPRC